jgi:glycosyltransferase involved in cell wall biosynthesis
MPTQPTIDEVDQKLTPHGLIREKYILFLGRLIPDKMAHLLIQAYAMARLERPELFADKPLVLVGGAAWTDKYASWMCALAAKTPGVIVLGERSGEELKALQAGALSHVFPTVSEGLSLAVVEACQFARLVVATNIQPNVEATGGHMISVRPLDVHSLVNGLIQAAELSQEDRGRIALAAQKHVMNSHHVNDRIDDVERMYRESCGKPMEMVSQVSIV